MRVESRSGSIEKKEKTSIESQVDGNWVISAADLICNGMEKIFHGFLEERYKEVKGRDERLPNRSHLRNVDDYQGGVAFEAMTNRVDGQEVVVYKAGKV